MENCDFNVRSGEEAHTKLRNIGPSIAKKIQVILDTGVLPGLNDSVGLEDKLKYFKNCYGIGSEIAKRWNLLNFESFCVAAKKDPEEFVSDWTILFGWSYYDDWLCKMSRNECFTHLKKVQKALRGIDPECQVELQGSYNRGYSKCGDIDLLFSSRFVMTRPSWQKSWKRFVLSCTRMAISIVFTANAKLGKAILKKNSGEISYSEDCWVWRKKEVVFF